MDGTDAVCYVTTDKVLQLLCLLETTRHNFCDDKSVVFHICI